ncbi:MAG: hypothetical protein A2X86_08435 [Bdellovibrionales bacterium GWA2_49_15]|nr:MAG: hypothetical protein A2X86_08435 [Bdellovibrionales bacterium GWA2_49_15]HAZ11211.1 hypothetical protein [Bdellovibrionales bacterium]
MSKKLLVLTSIFIFYAVAYAGQAMFHADIKWGEPHALSFNFTVPEKDWGKVDKTLITLKCDQDHILKTEWLNSRTIKAILDPSLLPGESCQVSLKGNSYFFKAPEIKILEVGPWSLSDNFHEEDPIYINTDYPLNEAKLLQELTLQVEGIEEKIEFDVIKDQVTLDALKKQNSYIHSRPVVWVKPRQKLPAAKKFKLNLAKGQTAGFTKDGIIRDQFQVTVSCERPKEDGPCIPLANLYLRFNSNVEAKYFDGIYYTLNGQKKYLEKSSESLREGGVFKAPLPADQEIEITLPVGMIDIDGRPLANAGKFPLKLKIGELPPLAKLPGAFGILEANENPTVPIAIRNVEQPLTLQLNTGNLKKSSVLDILNWQAEINERQDRRYEKDLRGTSFFADKKIELQIQKLKTVVGKNDLELLGLPLEKKGLYVVEVVSPKLGATLLNSSSNFYISSMILVTNMAVHLKTGEQNALVWITQLDTGKPLPLATVTLFNCQGAALATGKTNADGVAQFKISKNLYNQCTSQNYGQYGLLMAKAEYKDDMSFALNQWDRGIEQWRFQLPYYDHSKSIRYHTIFDRPIYQQKDRVRYLILARDAKSSGLALPTKTLLDDLVITHDGSGKEWLEKIKWTKSGTASTSFQLHEEAPLGRYTLDLVKRNEKNEKIETERVGGFEVQAFKVPLLHVKNKWRDNMSTFTVDNPGTLLGNFQYLSGGNASDLELNLHGEVSQKYYETEDFVWSNGDLSLLEQQSSAYQLEKKKLITDKNGGIQFQVPDLQKRNYLQKLLIEMEYIDPNGKMQSRYEEATIYPGTQIVGISTSLNLDDNINHAQLLKMKVQDLKQNAVAGALVQLEVYKHNYRSVRKKIIGGFYSYESFYEDVKADERCEGKTDAKGIFQCELAFKELGTYVFQASIKDGDGNLSVCHLVHSFYSDETWSPMEAHDRADLIPDKKEYSISDVAKLEFKIPFKEASVLLTKEREGIIDYQIINFSRANPFIELKLQEADAPNIYVGALAVRGREQSAQPTGQIDLGRPALRMGLTHLKVNNQKEISLAVIPEKDVYQVRDSVTVNIKLAPGEFDFKKTKIVMAVFDEGLLQLRPASSFEIKNAFKRGFSDTVDTASSIAQIIGKRHFGLKAKPHGGGGGRQLLRELFDTILFWNPEIAVSESGEARVQFKLNDSLTSFKIMVLAYTIDQFGVAEASIKSTQDILTFSGLSNVLRVGDQTFARYQLKNTTSKTYSLSAAYSNSVGGKVQAPVELAANESKSLAFPFVASDVPKIEHSLILREKTKVLDQLKNTQKILPLVRPYIKQADLVELKKELTVPASSPDSAHAGLKIDFSTTILGSAANLKDYMSEYIFECFEQRLAKAVVLSNHKLRNNLLKDLPTYLAENNLLRFYPMDVLEPSAWLTAHFLEITFWDHWSIPKTISDKMEQALAQIVEGKLPLKFVTPEDYEILKLKSMATLKLIKSAYFQSKWTSLLSTDFEKDTWETLESKWIIFGLSGKLTDARAALEAIKMRLTVKASAMEFSPRPEDQRGYYFSTPTTLYARFLLLQTVMPVEKEFKEFYLSNKSKLLRGFGLHKRYGHYGETLSNTFAFFVHKLIAREEKVVGKTLVNEKVITWGPESNPALAFGSEAQSKEIKFKHEGTGVIFPTISYLFWPDPKAAVSQGFAIRPPKLDQLFKQGETVELAWQLHSSQNSRPVALVIPVSPGASVLNVAVKGRSYLAFREIDNHEVRLYFDDFLKGEAEVTLKVRFDQPGTYQVPGAAMEEMYSPDRRGQAAYATWEIR